MHRLGVAPPPCCCLVRVVHSLCTPKPSACTPSPLHFTREFVSFSEHAPFALGCPVFNNNHLQTQRLLEMF